MTTGHYAEFINSTVLPYDHDMRFFISALDGEIARNLPLKDPNKQRTPLLLEEQGSTERQLWRRDWDSNPGSHLRRTTVFETATFNHSAISP